MMDASWRTTISLDQPKQSTKENYSIGAKSSTMNTGIKTAGDGMGGKKETGKKLGFGDDSDGEEAGGVNKGKFMAGRSNRRPRNQSLGVLTTARHPKRKSFKHENRWA
jgi:hypothetical protein